MAVGTDPRYRALAVIAAGEIGAPPTHDLLVAITAQWQCEQPSNQWPPVHNNPGFVTSGAMHSVGEPATSASSSPGAGFLAQYATPELGARAYGRLIAKGNRYSSAQAKAIAGDGAGFLAAITAAGYGTRYSCSIGAYKANGGANVGTGPGGATGGGGGSSSPAPKPTGGTVSAIIGARLAGACSVYTILAPGNGTETRIIPIPRELIADACTICPTGWSEAVVTVGPIQMLQGFVSPADLPPGTRNACVAPGVKVGDNPGFDQGAGAAGGALGDVAGAILGGLVGALSPLLFLALFLGLILLGLYVVATSESRGLPAGTTVFGEGG